MADFNCDKHINEIKKFPFLVDFADICFPFIFIVFVYLIFEINLAYYFFLRKTFTFIIYYNLN